MTSQTTIRYAKDISESNILCQMPEKIIIKINQQLKQSELVASLLDYGYEKITPNEEIKSGQFLVLGGLIKVFATNSLNPIAIELFGDYVEELYSFDPLSKKKIQSNTSYEIDRNALYLSDHTIIRPGNYIVHEDYGIGLFESIEVKVVESSHLRYINLRYFNNDLLRMPFEQSDKLTRYIGVGRRKPKLSRLGSISWQKTYKKTYENILILARELLVIYAKRQVVNKKPRIISMDWDMEVRNTFGFEDTKDQAQAIQDVYGDLQKNTPIDRLICGDVGFGKTEIALRAAVQTVANNYQVAILVPTTILAEQHYAMFKKRLINLPINVVRLSRFTEKSEAKITAEQLRNGSADIVIGTHKIIKSNLTFKKLGLLIVDEEQKFGVKDKEKLKGLREDIDILTLTATPIPRTLYMALSGIREISQISSIPRGRKSIDTSVKKYDIEDIRFYVEREIGRGGQIYYLHNEVQSIQAVKSKLQKQFKNLEIEVAHGQMGEEKLADIMRRFAEGSIQMLVCSTIIENGLDLPNVNTLIVEDSDHFGLSQLYQIRGRIGRSTKQAYALFSYQGNLSPNATKRLKALAENTELGGGYSIALEDLEIRGGGNILGKEQHGNMESIGLILYSKLLQMAVSKLKQTN